VKEGQNIEKLFKDRFDTFEVDPGNHLWDKIQAEIPSSGLSEVAAKTATSSAKAGSSMLTTLVVGGAISVIAVTGYYFFESKADRKPNPTETKQEIDPTLPQEDSKTIEADVAEEGSGQEPLIPKKGIEQSKAANQEQTERSEQTEVAAEESKRLEESKANSENAAKVEESTPLLQDEIKAKNNPLAEEGSKLQTDEQQSDQSQLSSTGSDTEMKTPVAEPEAAATNSSTRSTGPSKNTVTTETQIDSDEDQAIDPLMKEEEDETASLIEAYEPDNVFTPNGDGVNDIFQVDLNTLKVDAIEVQIFDRKNQLIHQWNDVYGYWDGRTRDGSLAPEGPYFYVIKINADNKDHFKRGVLTLSRGSF